MRLQMFRTGAAALAFAAAFLAGPAFAETVKMSATLLPGKDVPKAQRTGTGKIAVTFDTETRILAWRVEFSGLTGPLEAAHFHGHPGPGDPTGTIVPIKRIGTPPAESLLEGSATLTEKQASELMAGEWHVKLHTAGYPDGEIRGALAPAT
jgi:hypothetical protein